MGFGERIKAARLAVKLSQAKLAEKIGVTKAAVSGWESGDTKSIDGDNLLAAAKALNLTPEFIMNGKNPPNKGQLSSDEQELLELYHNLSDAERASMLGFLRAIKGTRTAPPLPDLEDID